MHAKEESFRAYLDESEVFLSGTFAVGGFVGRTEVWHALEPDWLKCLPKAISIFHATDCFTGNGQFEGVSIQDRITLLDALTDLLGTYEVWLIGYGIDAPAYRKLAPRARENEFLRNKYAGPLGGAVQLACHCMGNTPKPANIGQILDHGENWEQCLFVIESNEYEASLRRTFVSMRHCRELWYRARIGRDLYLPKAGQNSTPLLQVADLGAFLAAKSLARAADGAIAWAPNFGKLVNANRVYQIVLADESDLQKLHGVHRQLKEESEGYSG